MFFERFDKKIIEKFALQTISKSFNYTYGEFILPNDTNNFDAVSLDNSRALEVTIAVAENNMKGMANIILLGKLLKETGIASMETVEKAMNKVIPPKKAHLVEVNLKAIKLGMEQ